MEEIEKLILGYKNFHQKYFVENSEVYKRLAKDGQFPSVAIIACSDSRVDPSIITDAKPGEVFVIRNVANLVPPYQPDDETYHGTSAALEFAVNSLKVKHVIVFGHSKCAGIRTLLDEKSLGDTKESFIKSWMKIADEVKEEVLNNHSSLTLDQQLHICERKAISKSLQNLTTFPWIEDKISAKELSLHGWHFDLDTGTLWSMDNSAKNWVKVS